MDNHPQAFISAFGFTWGPCRLSHAACGLGRVCTAISRDPHRSSMLLTALNCSAPLSTRPVLAMHRSVACSAAKSVRLAVVGDVHGQWCPDRDAAALQALHADFTLFVGDFGNERVPLVRQIAELEAPKAVILVSVIISVRHLYAWLARHYQTSTC